LGDLLTLLDADPTLDAKRRKTFEGALRTLCCALAREATAVPASMPEIDELLKAVPASARGRSKKTIDNARSLAKSALLRYSPPLGLPPRGTPLRPKWQELANKLTDARLRNGLSRFIRIASYQRIEPCAVNDEVVDQIVNTVAPLNWGRDVTRFREQVTTLWNEAVAEVPGWPQTNLTIPAKQARERHRPLSSFPVSFQQDLAAYLERASGRDLLAADAPAQPLSATTLKLRADQLRIAASTLADHLGGPEPVVTLAVLVKPEHVKKVLTSFLKTGPQMQVSAFTRGLYVTLRAVARQWVKAPPTELEELARMQRKLGSAPSGLTVKNRTLIRQIDDPRVLSQLLALPAALRKELQTRRLSPARRLQKMQIALAIELLLCAPMRLQNLATLRVDQQLQWPSGRGGQAYIVLNATETKNEEPLEYPLPGRVKDMLHEYLDRYRSYTAAASSPWLFVKMDGSPVTAGTLRDGIKKAIKRGVGIDMTPHQFRHVAAAIALDHSPGAIGLVQGLLGHKNPKTTANFYSGMRTRQAGLEYDKLLASRRVPESPRS
jgi:integrase